MLSLVVCLFSFYFGFSYQSASKTKVAKMSKRYQEVERKRLQEENTMLEEENTRLKEEKTRLEEKTPSCKRKRLGLQV